MPQSARTTPAPRCVGSPSERKASRIEGTTSSFRPEKLGILSRPRILLVSAIFVTRPLRRQACRGGSANWFWWRLPVRSSGVESDAIRRLDDRSGGSLETDAGACECPASIDAGLSGPPQPVRWSLECGCGVTSCPATLVDYDATYYCDQSATVIRSSGCGLVAFETFGYAGRVDVFDEASKELRGVYLFSDIVSGVCASSNAFGYIFGEPPPSMSGCADVTRCTVCGNKPPRRPCARSRPTQVDFDGGAVLGYRGSEWRAVMRSDLGPVYTQGRSYRARAEARQLWKINASPVCPMQRGSGLPKPTCGPRRCAREFTAKCRVG